MPPTNQSFLSRSAEGELCLKKLPPPINLKPRRSSSRSLKQDRVSILPDEMLSEIFSHLPPQHWWDFVWNRQPTKEDIENAFPLALVCERWRRIYEPRLYHELGFSFNAGSGPSRFRRILAILSARPHLYRHVRSINVHINDNPLTFQDPAKLLEKFTGLRTVTLSSSYPEESRCLLEAVKRVPLLADLTLRGNFGTVSIQVVLQSFLLRSLQSLKLPRYGVSKSSTGLPSPDRNWNWKPAAPPLALTQMELEQLLPPAQYYTGNVISMAFDEPTASFNITEHLLRWPTPLVELSITSL
jgi:hypothetical protein